MRICTIHIYLFRYFCLKNWPFLKCIASFFSESGPPESLIVFFSRLTVSQQLLTCEDTIEGGCDSWKIYDNANCRKRAQTWHLYYFFQLSYEISPNSPLIYILEWLQFYNRNFRERTLAPESEMKGLAFIKGRLWSSQGFFRKYFPPFFEVLWADNSFLVSPPTTTPQSQFRRFLVLKNYNNNKMPFKKKACKSGESDFDKGQTFHFGFRR